MSTQTAEKIADIIETATCSRCGGSGRMPYSVHNGVCFKCGGRGVCDTKRGASARAFYRSLVRTPATAIQPGERVYMDGVSAGTFSMAGGWTTVDEVIDIAARPYRASSCSSLRVTEIDKIAAAVERGATIIPAGVDTKGEDRVHVFEGLTIRCTQRNGDGYTFGAASGSTVLAAIDKSVKRAIIRTVAEYQDGLTKAGRPRKGTRWAS